jgi:hypothetical protein
VIRAYLGEELEGEAHEAEIGQVEAVAEGEAIAEAEADAEPAE